MIITKYSSSFEKQILELLSTQEVDSKTRKPYDFEFFNKEFGTYYKQFLALENDKVVGVIVHSKQFDTIELNFIYVKPSLRKSGLAQQLFQKINTIQNIDGIRVNCGQENKQAQKFYEKLGFQKVGKVNNYFSNENVQYFYWMKK